MNNYPRQAKEIESLTAQLNAARNLGNTLAGVVSRQCAELMALREKVVLLERRPTLEKYGVLVEERDRWEDEANHFCTELQVARTHNDRLRQEMRVAKDVIAHKNQQINRLSSDMALAEKRLRDMENRVPLSQLPDMERVPCTQYAWRKKVLDAQMQEAQAMLEPPCDCPMCEARGM